MGLIYDYVPEDIELEGAFASHWFYPLMCISFLLLIVLAIGLLKYVNEKKRSGNLVFQPWNLIFFLSLMLGWSLISAILSNHHDIAFFGCEYRRDGFMSYVFYAAIFGTALMVRSKKCIRIILEVFVGVSALVGYIELLNIETLNRIMSIRLLESGVFYQKNHYGYYLCMTLLTCVVLYMMDEWKFKEKSF